MGWRCVGDVEVAMAARTLLRIGEGMLSSFGAPGIRYKSRIVLITSRREHSSEAVGDVGSLLLLLLVLWWNNLSVRNVWRREVCDCDCDCDCDVGWWF